MQPGWLHHVGDITSRRILLLHRILPRRFCKSLHAVRAAEGHEALRRLHAVNGAGRLVVHRADVIDGPGGKDGGGHRQSQKERGKECFHGVMEMSVVPCALPHERMVPCAP